MHKSFLLLAGLAISTCKEKGELPPLQTPAAFLLKTAPTGTAHTWVSFLQHLPEKAGPIIDYSGNLIANQRKHAAIIDYDIGNSDLQQCADALMRLRAEYLFAEKRYADIHFRFTGGQTYSFLQFCEGRRPVAAGTKMRLTDSPSSPAEHRSLRRYLDIVYAYAGTLSLAQELPNTEWFSIGTVVIHPGSPGHCFIITDETVTAAGDTVYKLVEGYMPAQSIYVLRNLSEPALGVWHRLKRGPIETASYRFTDYRLKTFE